MAVWWALAADRPPVGSHASVSGSYNSALVVACPPVSPPATSTRPPGSSVPLCPLRAVLIDAAATQVPVRTPVVVMAVPLLRVGARSRAWVIGPPTRQPLVTG